jgi:hypothetical protein
MRTVKVRILPPQPIFSVEMMALVVSAVFIPIALPFRQGQFRCSNPNRSINETVMARKAEATLWMLVKIGERSVMKWLTPVIALRNE